MDQLELAIRFVHLPRYPEHRLQLGVEALLNGLPVSAIDDLPLDLVALRASTTVPDDYYFWNCTCGIPECGGVSAPVTVSHEGDAVVWRSHAHPLDDFGGELRFDKAAYVHTVTRMLEQLQYELIVRRANGELFDWILDQEAYLFQRDPWKQPLDEDRPRPSRGKPIGGLKRRK